MGRNQPEIPLKNKRMLEIIGIFLSLGAAAWAALSLAARIKSDWEEMARAIEMIEKENRNQNSRIKALEKKYLIAKDHQREIDRKQEEEMEERFGDWDKAVEQEFKQLEKRMDKNFNAIKMQLLKLIIRSDATIPPGLIDFGENKDEQ